jgi:CRISPR-associated protein Csm2
MPSGSRSLPSGYLKGGYFDTDGRNPKREVLLDWAEGVADTLTSKNMTSSSLRTFFNTIRAMDSRLRSGEPFDSIKTMLFKAKALVAYAVSRGSVPNDFREFVDMNIALASQDSRSFKAFMDHFECVVGYFKDRSNQRRG